MFTLKNYQEKTLQVLEEYLGQYGGLIGDKRTGVTFSEIVKGIITAGSLVCQQIAAHSPVLAAVQDGSQRVIRFVKGKSTKRSQVKAKDLVTELCRRGVAQLAESDANELWRRCQAAVDILQYASSLRWKGGNWHCEPMAAHACQP